MRIKKYCGHKLKKKIKEFNSKDEDELLDLVSEWANSDDYNNPLYEKGEWIVPKLRKKGEKKKR